MTLKINRQTPTPEQQRLFREGMGMSSTFIRWCIPGRDISGTVFKDISGRGNDAVIDASNTGPFAADSRMCSVAHASAGGLTVPAAAVASNLTTDSWIMAFSMTRATPAGGEALAAFGASTGNNSPGVYFSHRSSPAGAGRLVMNRGNGTLISGVDTAATFSNAGGTVERHVLMAYDAPTRSLYLYRDGILAYSGHALASGANEWTVTTVVGGARLGGTLGGNTTYPGAFRGWQGYVFTGKGLPLNLGWVAGVLAENPNSPLNDAAFLFPAKDGAAKYLVSLIGQSNEYGSGPTGSKSRTSGIGTPFVDTGNRSWWPSALESAGRRGSWIDVANTAVGSTSLCDSWVGRCRTWASGMVVTRGTYVLSGGGLWRCAVAASTVMNSTVAPTGTANVTGADSVAWVYVGVPGAGDTNGTVYTQSSSRYDPNGYIAAALAALASRPGYSAKGVYVSLGQGDNTVGSTRAQYAAAMVAVAQHVTSLGHTCWLGVTCGMSGADAATINARDSTMVNVLIAGRQDALTTLAGNALVKVGADLRTALGVPVASAVDTTRNAVNSTDYVHLTSATYDQAGAFVDAAFAAGGW